MELRKNEKKKWQAKTERETGSIFSVNEVWTARPWLGISLEKL